jgi:hypothetical protein
MADRQRFIPTMSTPAAAGHSWVGARMFAIRPTNLPRGS